MLANPVRARFARASRRNRQGFSLLEVLLALTIGVMVLVLANGIVRAVAGPARAVVAARATLDRTMNAQRWLRAAFLSLDMGTDTALPFDGHPERVRFSTWLQTADGWFARRTVTLARQERRFVATTAPGSAIVLGDSVDDVALDYLLEPGADARWVREWVSPLTAPLAVRLRVRTGGQAAIHAGAGRVDTLLFLMKERG